ETLVSKIPTALIAIDVPIGLPASGSRSCDVRARKLLGRPRGSSVFPAPVRACLRDGDYASLCSLHRAIDGRGLTKQAFCLLSKIRQGDDLLVRVPAFSECVREVHPEVSFALWNDGRPMRFNKAKSEGQRERQRLIDREWPGERERLMRELREGRFVKDDLNDACAALWSARRIAAGQAEQLPDHVERDSKGLQMRIEA
ncbi:MAG TPA: DUF429 domain-containing protein, partial [Steroidobacteraceae bacterium]|nr:DUF429 domain-containing protein [Steroidobacteraceae bacterium]